MKLPTKFRTMTIREQLFISFSLLVVLLILVLLLLTTSYLGKQTLERREMENRQTAQHIAKEIDSQIENMEAAKRQFLYSTDTMLAYSDYLLSRDVSKRSALLNQVSAALYRVMNNGVPQIYLMAVHGDDGSVISATTGRRNSLICADSASRVALLREPGFTAGTTIAAPDETDGGVMIRMLVRFVSTKNIHTHALLEVQQRYGVFANIIENAANPAQKSVFVFDGDGNMIYPYGTDVSAIACYRDTSRTMIPRGSSGEQELAAYDYAPLAGWTIVVVETESEFSKPIVYMRNLVIAIGIVTLFVCFVVIYLISTQLTRPLMQLQNEVQGITLESLGQQALSDTPAAYNEYEQLRASFNTMQVKLKASTEAYIEAKREQNETQLLALQSKMHPHFINNILASIQIMAARGETQDVIAICEHLSAMLSYSMEDYNGTVALKEEYQYTSCYVELMKIRYPRRLVCTFDIPADMYEVPVPKMILQPLVENCVKHGMRPDGLRIQVSGRLDGERFILAVADDGKGFDTKAAALYGSGNLHKKARRRSPEHGIGLNNIYQRLQLYYGEDALFSIRQDGGRTIVEIGGKRKKVGPKDV